MAIVRKTIEEIRAAARLEADTPRRQMTEDEIEANALSDPDALPATDEMLERGVVGRDLRRTRERLGLSQEAFAARYGISLGRVRDVEQGRHAPDPVLVSYVKLIARDPDWVAETIAGRQADHAA
ncbi:helix-turn-helix domain-containing protein [Salinarimonas ramus]|uniref:HTH cro/C1-type domain-containing protein n=1 Tax=Salinarimonas ramus TaxID=690164 RepID=A0A917QGR0_9HYPH|nr:helix-turn-helix domain-containing protein [Salinarimonas ramus]GGK49812.1 hypothetical protein GCM10011322_41030 [Salinarimonas ramus]